MKSLFIIALTVLTMAFTSSTKNLHSFKANTLEGKEFDFASLKGKKVLIVNTASECGYTVIKKHCKYLLQPIKAKAVSPIAGPNIPRELKIFLDVSVETI